MPVPGTQVNLTLGQETTIPTPGGISPTVGQQWSVEIENISPWVLSVNVSGKTYALAPGMGQLYFSGSGPSAVTVTPSGSAASGSFYVLSNWAVSPDVIPGTFPVVVAPSLTGAIVANQPMASMPGSPYAWAAPSTVPFTWPAGGPYSSVTLTVYAGVTFTAITVKGATTGRVYLNEVIDEGEWKLPVSSLVEPAGITVQANVAYGYGGAWSFEAALVATVSPDIVAPVYGPGVGGPTNFADGLVQSNTTASWALVGGGRSTTLRVWSAWLTMQVQGAPGAVSNRGYIGYPGGNILTCALGAAANTNGHNAVSLTYPGGLVVPIGNNVAPLTLSVDATTNAFVAAGGIAYSLDSA